MPHLLNPLRMPLVTPQPSRKTWAHAYDSCIALWLFYPPYIFANAAGTTHISAEGEPVRAVRDIKNGHLLTQSGAESLCPVFNADGASGRPSVYFDGSNDYLYNGSFVDMPNKASFVALVEIETLPTTNSFRGLFEWTWSASTINRGISVFIQDTSNVDTPKLRAMDAATPDDAVGATIASPDVRMWSGVYDESQGAGAQLLQYKNGAADGTGGTAGVGPSNPLDRVWVGSLHGGLLPWKGWIRELALFDDALTAEQLNMIHTAGPSIGITPSQI